MHTVIADEGFYFGIGAFETVAVHAGKPLLLPRHMRRLGKSLDFLGINHRETEVRRTVDRTLQSAEEGVRGNGTLKIVVTQANIDVSLTEGRYGPQAWERGFAAAISPIRRNETSPFVYHKTLNYGDSIFEKRRAKAQGVDEPLFLNSRGELCEGATSNIFFVREGTLFTPPVACGLLPGIAREVVIESYPVVQRTITPAELPQFDEAFLTNSLFGIMPLTRIGEVRFGSRKAADALLERLRPTLLQ